MPQYVARRLLAFAVTLAVVAVLIFFMISLVPGDPVAMLLGNEASGEEIQRVRTILGLDRPLGDRFVEWVGRAAVGDLGRSYFLNESVMDALAERVPITVSLAACALVIAAFVGISAGIFAALRRGRASDWGVMVAAMAGLSVPIFWLGLNLIFLFAVTLRWLPTGGYVSLGESPAAFARHMTMPALALGLAYAAAIARMTRSAMLEVLRNDYVRTARAKGLRERVVVYRHAFKNALIPVITVLGIATGELLGGSVITETVFNLPGVGRLVVEGVRRRDYPIVQGGILLVTFGYLVVNLVVDLLYAVINPRIRYSS